MEAERMSSRNCLENIQNNLANLQKVETNGNSKNEGNNNSRK